MVKIDIISGFLGAGKTTLLAKLLNVAFQGERVALIENDFGDVSIDSQVLQNTGVKITEVKAGCICCTLAGKFEKAMTELVERYQPDRIMIEPSGIGMLSEVVQVLNKRKLQQVAAVNMVITVVDANNFATYLSSYGDFYSDQIRFAKTIVLSRIEDNNSERLAKLKGQLGQLNPFAPIVCTPWANLNGDDLVALAEGGINPKEVQASDDLAQPSFESWTMQTERTFTEAELAAICRELGSGSNGQVLRVKGIVADGKGRQGWLKFDFVPGEFKCQTLEVETTSRVCVIGTDLRQAVIAALFRD